MSDIRTEYEKFADPRAKYISSEVFTDGLSIAYQVEGYPHISRAYEPFEANRHAGGIKGAAQQIGKDVLKDLPA